MLKFFNKKMMNELTRFTFNPEIMGGKPCIIGIRVTVGMIVVLIESGYTNEEILKACPYIEPEYIKQVLSYAAWRVVELEVSMNPA